MNSTERIKAMIAGKAVDRPGVSAWKHFYLEDRHPTDFVKRTVEFQESNDWDFVKISYNGYLMPEAFQAEIRWSPDSNTFPTMLKHNVNHPQEWLKLVKPSVDSGALNREYEATARIVDHFGGTVPVLPTVFSPLTAAQEMSCGWLNPWPILADIEYSPNELHRGLEIITESIIQFVDKLVQAGVDGLFFPTQLACHSRLTPELYQEFGRKYDLMVLDAIKNKTWFNVVHIHGTDRLFFKEIEDYPVQAFNWEDVNSNLSLQNTRAMTDKILISGIEQLCDFDEPDRDKLKDHLRKRVQEAVKAAGPDRLVIAPGCCVPTQVPEYRLTVLKEVVDELR